MDTTAAAELGGGVVDGGVGFWDTGGVAEPEGWTGAEKSGYNSGPPNTHGWGDGGGSRGRPSSGASSMEPPSKRMRNMSGGDGNAGSGNFNSPGGGFAQGGLPDGGGLRAGYGLPPGTPSGGESSAAGQGMTRGRGMGSIFYKTKLCSRFRNGNCPYSNNCNFAHGMDELRRPPPGWEDTSGPQEGCGGGPSGGGVGGGSGAATAAAGGGSATGPGGGGGSAGVTGGSGGAGAGAPGVSPNQQPAQSPVIQGGSNDMQRFHKTRPCKKYFSELGCPYGDRCNFLHDEPNPQTSSKPARESIVVTVAANGAATGNGTASSAAPAPSPTQRPPNWKTRLCNKWETTGNCPFGDKCHFAHGSAELQRYGGGPIDPSSAEGVAAMQIDSKYGSGNFAEVDEGFSNHSDGFAQVVNLRQSSSLLHRNSRPGQGSGMALKTSAVWKGPTDGISTIYGDWVEEDEWETSGAQIAKDLQNFGQNTSSFVHRGTDSANETPARRDKEPQNTPLSRNSSGQNQANGYLNASGSGRGYTQSSQGFDLGYAEANLGL